MSEKKASFLDLAKAYIDAHPDITMGEEYTNLRVDCMNGTYWRFLADFGGESSPILIDLEDLLVFIWTSNKA